MPKLFQPDILMFSYSAALITIATPNLNELAKFYEALLQLPPQVWLPDTYAEFAIAQLKLGIFQPQTCSQKEFAQPTRSAMSLCLEVVDLAAAIAHLTRLGFPPPHPIITASHGREVYAYDPDGNRLILHQGRDNGPAESLNQG